MIIILQCDVSQIEELQKVIQEYKKIMNSKVINKYNITDQKLSQEGCKYADNIFSNLDLKNKDLVIQYILEKGNNEIDKTLANIDLETRKKILTYIYWKYRGINSEFKVDLKDIKAKFGIKANEPIEKYTSPLLLEVKCVICGGKAEIIRYRYEKSSYVNFKCNNCKHEEFEDKSSDSYSSYIIYRHKKEVFVKCNCRRCKKNKTYIYNMYKEDFMCIIDKLKNEIIKTYEREVDDRYCKTNDLSNERMKMDYKINASMLDKDIREILSYKPDNEKELINIIEQISNKGYRGTKEYIINKLVRAKIIYLIAKKDIRKQLNDSMSIIIRGILGIPFEDDKTLNSAIKWIENNTAIEFWNLLTEDEVENDKVERTVETEVVKNLTNTICKLLKEIIASNGILMINGYEEFMQPDIQINPYYFNEKLDNDEKSNHLNFNRDESNFKNIFRSEAEKDLYFVLANKYKNFILVPNLKIYKFIDMEKLKEAISSFLGKESFEYLKGCEVDFVLFDLNGVVAKVIELQKGKHHNKEEWIKKDALKRKLLNLLGIEFEEMF